mgnify:CR=1 FL=1
MRDAGTYLAAIHISRSASLSSALCRVSISWSDGSHVSFDKPVVVKAPGTCEVSVKANDAPIAGFLKAASIPCAFGR